MSDLPPALFIAPGSLPAGHLVTPCAACSQFGRTPLRNEYGTRVLTLDGPLCGHCHGTGSLGTRAIGDMS